MSRRKKRSNDSGGGGSDDWLTTYSDLVTLLLCFFVLLFSFAEIDAEKFRMISQSLKAGFSGGTGILDTSSNMEPPIPVEGESLDEEEMQDLYNQLKEYSELQDLGDQISVIPEERGIVIRFKDNVFFDSGVAEIKPESKRILDAAASVLNKEEFQKRHIKIEGHTDSDPIIHSYTYPTNWELSSARATNVLRYLIEEDAMDGSRLSSSGYGEHRPIEKNNSKENKAKNRRVDIVILKDIFEEMEPGGME